MKIPLLIEEETKSIEDISFVEKRIILPLTIVGRGLVKTSFIIDTGSPFSFINYPNFSRLNLSKGKIIVKDLVIGNTTVNLFSTPKLKLYMKSEEETVASFETLSITVALPSEKEKEKEEAYKLPNIVGLDFLEKHELKLFINIKGKDCYLEL